ncbi:Rne/Rng family ribonuclease [Christensenellaceae bacterium OttesenSCG-928-L17]|nr:Rne/Rng family ribonuclease [Christensenellaceae bacterium OttesenSCG-928-L17]
MHKEIVVEMNPYQTRVVLLENGQPSEIYIERRGHERIVGNIYYGKVQNVLPGMQAAFVDIGLERNAFLYAGDVQTERDDFQLMNGEQPENRSAPVQIQDIVKPGQEIMVQIVKEPVGTKGARVTTHITLAGRTLVLMPTTDYVCVSRRIGDDDERTRLRNILTEIKPQDMGVIIRTAAAGKTKEEFEPDIRFLERLWARIHKKRDTMSAPRLLHAEEPLIFRTIRDLFTPDIERLTINDNEFYERIQIVANIISPQMRDKVVLYQGEDELFDRYDLEAKIDKALARKVWLANGGYIVIDQTEALTSIDVNTGRFVGVDNLQETITAANCEAAKEIARQLRLRDISGIIIIDFIDMEEIADKERVLDTLKQELKKDRTKSNVLGITQLGLVEMTRKKMRHSISNTLQTTCPYCKGDGKVRSPETMALKVRRELMRQTREESMTYYLLEVHPEVAALMNDHASAQSPLLPGKAGRQYYVRAVETFHMEEFRVVPVPSQAELPPDAVLYGAAQ